MTDYPSTFRGRARRYFWNVLIGFDQWANTWFGGDPDETISSRLGKWLRMPKKTWRHRVAYVICRMLHPLDANHCRKSIESDEGEKATWK